MAKIIPIRRGALVRTEWDTVATVVSNPRDPYTGRYCKADEWQAEVTLRDRWGDTWEERVKSLRPAKRLGDFTPDDLAQLRKEVVLNSLYYTDYRNSFGIDCHSASLFFDSYLSFISEMAEEDGYKWDYAEPGSTYYQEGYHTWSEFLERYDTTDNLCEWWGCYESFDWVMYEGEYEKEQRMAA